MADAEHQTYAEFLKSNKLAEDARILYCVHWIETFTRHCGGMRASRPYPLNLLPHPSLSTASLRLT